MTSLHSARLDGFRRVPGKEYWDGWIRRSAEALDSNGLPDPTRMRGWELVSTAGGASGSSGGGSSTGGGEVTTAYLIAKAAASFSAGVEVVAGGSGGGLQEQNQLTVLDFASTAPPGSEASEAALFTLLSAARESYFDRAVAAAPPTVVTAAVPRLIAPRAAEEATSVVDTDQGTWMYADVSAAAAALHGGEHGTPGPLAIRSDKHLVLALDEF